MELRGIDKSVFVNQDTDYFDCIICSDVAIKPKMCGKCEHIFCGPCIKQWVSTNHYCPFKCQDKENMVIKDLPKSVKNVYGNLTIKCTKEECGKEMPLKDLAYHEMVCGIGKCNTHGCENPIRYNFYGKDVCGEKCAIYYILKNRGSISKDLLHTLLSRFTKKVRFATNNRSALCLSIPSWDLSKLPQDMNVIEEGNRIESTSSKKGFKTIVSPIVRF